MTAVSLFEIIAVNVRCLNPQINRFGVYFIGVFAKLVLTLNFKRGTVSVMPSFWLPHD